jgi:hypothetical protein
VYVVVEGQRIVGLAGVVVMSILERDHPIARITAAAFYRRMGFEDTSLRFVKDLD